MQPPVPGQFCRFVWGTSRPRGTAAMEPHAGKPCREAHANVIRCQARKRPADLVPSHCEPASVKAPNDFDRRSGWHQAASLLGNSPSGVSAAFAPMRMARDLPETSVGNEVRSNYCWRCNMPGRAVRLFIEDTNQCLRTKPLDCHPVPTRISPSLQCRCF